jgi:hypothetical protein
MLVQNYVKGDLTSLTGIDETPISIAINQQALWNSVSHKNRSTIHHPPEVSAPAKDTGRERKVIRNLNIGNVLRIPKQDEQI